jgi:ElaB/YqjD/DUF883 family membrane-anchored ribosome-binding protein
VQVYSGRREEDTAKSRLQSELQRLRQKIEQEQREAAMRAKQANEAVAAASRESADPASATGAQVGPILRMTAQVYIRGSGSITGAAPRNYYLG